MAAENKESQLRKEPQRTCIACRRKGDQSSFLRVSRMSEGRVIVCGGGGLGRSGYICPVLACVESALVKEKLGRALKSQISETQKEALKKELVCKLR